MEEFEIFNTNNNNFLVFGREYKNRFIELNDIQVPYTHYLQNISANAEVAELKDETCREYKLDNENKIEYLKI